ncbi:MAG TPA: 3D domain-containing protein [Gaiellaceae bacterium]|nr:3D domain-containing protein [Gaiellaceae bacterium]
MGGHDHTSLRRLVLVVVAALAIVATPIASGAGSPLSPTQSLQRQDANLAAKTRSAVLGLYALDHQLVTAQTRLAALQASLSELKIERVALKHELLIARANQKIAVLHAETRLRQLYERGNVEPIEVLFGARNLDDALSSMDSLKRIASQDEAIVAELHDANARYAVASRALTSRTQQVAGEVTDAAATANALSQARLQRTSYISSLQAKRSYTQRQISQLESEAAAAQQKSNQITDSRARSNIFTSSSGPSSTPTSSTQGRTITVLATAYSMPGHTASGLPVGWGVVAVDPSVIPLGSHMYVPGYGDAVAADTGGAIIGNRIDLWFPTIAQAYAWGSRLVTITVY